MDDIQRLVIEHLDLSVCDTVGTYMLVSRAWCDLILDCCKSSAYHKYLANVKPNNRPKTRRAVLCKVVEWYGGAKLYIEAVDYLYLPTSIGKMCGMMVMIHDRFIYIHCSNADMPPTYKEGAAFLKSARMQPICALAQRECMQVKIQYKYS